jgi:glycosyltransferase involved in cell wall biosynthesis
VTVTRGAWRRVVAGVAALAPALLLPLAPDRAAADPAGTLTVSRVDVSRWPEVGFVLTPAHAGTLAGVRRDLVVRSTAGRLQATVTSLSAGDLQVVVVPDVDVAPDRLAEQRTALTRLVVGLPAGARTGVLTGADPAAMPEISADPTGAVRGLALAGGAAVLPPAERLQAALADFAPGARVRRTVMAVTAGTVPASATILDNLRRRLAASGTTLFVLDLSATGRSPLAGLAAATGGAVYRSVDELSEIPAMLTHQYYVRVQDHAALPHPLAVTLGDQRGVADLPLANPVAPPPWVVPPLPPPPPAPIPAHDVALIGLGMALVGTSLAYGLAMLLASRRDPRRFRRSVARIYARRPIPDDLFFVFMLPCLNEDRVIMASLRRLLSFPGRDYAVMVVDDDSDDDTAAVVSAVESDRVWLLRRRAPDARQGKGEALNAAVRELVAGGRLAGRDPDRVIVAVVDADGRLEPTALREVTPYFADRTVAGVQIGVRINNRRASWLARMQDMEFVIFTEVFQRGRRHLNSVGLGGNGQFMRLSALQDLGPAPWSRCLTEDLDLGVRLLARGWRNDFCSTAAVHQQGLVGLRRLLRQRTRWFQGHLQSWRLVPMILRGTPGRARTDLLYHLSSPLLLLIASLMTSSFVVSLGAYAVLLAGGQDPAGWWLLSTYLLAFGPAVAYSVVYWTKERTDGLSLSGAILLAHVYVGYGLIWYAAGWRAVVRALRGESGWTKTERTVEPAVVELAGGTP